MRAVSEHAALYLGTSGYSFRDWVGKFYPPGTSAGEMFAFYATRFRAVEINATYYRLPPPSAMVRLAQRAPSDFAFTVKLHQDVTHRQTRSQDDFRAFREVVEPLRAAGKFHGALAQFPFRFRGTRDHARYLRFLRGELREIPLFVEFRHASWATERVFRFLEDQGLGFCSVDEPDLPGLFPPILRRCGPDLYVRFHGRNGAQWWSGDGSSRYDHLYSERDLRPWAEKIREASASARKTFVFFNNCHDGNAATNANQMAELLRGALSEGAPRVDPPPPGDSAEGAGRLALSHEAGLCADCRHARRVESARGPRYWLCARNQSDPSYPKYPHLPVLRCRGHEPEEANATR